MKHLKFVIAAAGILGIVACFLPYVGESSFSLSMWDMRKLPGGHSGLINGPKQVYIALALFAIPAFLAATALASKLQRALAGIAAGSFLLTFALELVRVGMTRLGKIDTSIGGKLVFIAAAVGLVTSIIATVKPEK